MDLIYNLPERVLENICCWLVSSDAHGSFRTLANFRCVSKNLFGALTDAKILGILQSVHESRSLVEPYIINMLLNYIRASNIASYVAFVTFLHSRIKSHWLSRLRKEQLLYVVRFSTVEFLKQYTDLNVLPSKSLQFTSANIIKAVDIANERKDGSEMLLYLVPMMTSLCFSASDPQHISRIMDHIKSGNKLNSRGDYFRKLFIESRHAQKYRSSALGTSLLLPLLNPPREVVVIPQGTIFRNFSMETYRLKKSFQRRFTITVDSGRAWIKYLDCRVKSKTIEVQENKGTYTYEGFSTNNLYELFLRTSIFSQVFGTFAQQHVAFTEENVDLDPSDQPWFFGAISESEAEEILSNAGGYPAIITRAIGSEIYVSYTRPKFSNVMLSDYRLTMKFRDILTRADHSYPKFFSALYNGGERKNMMVYHTYRTVVSKPIDDIIKFIIENRITLSDPIFSSPNILLEYVKVCPSKLEKFVVQYLVNQGVPLHDEIILWSWGKCEIDLILWLIEKGAKMKPITLMNILPKYQPNLAAFKILFGATEIKNLDAVCEDVIQTLMKHGLTQQTYGSGMQHGMLVRLAWRFGNEDNLFKALPKELIEVICSYGLDRPEWWDIAEHVIQNTTIKLLPESVNERYAIFDLAPFIWNYWDRFSKQLLREIASRMAFDSNLPYSIKGQKHNMTKMIAWTSKFGQRVECIDLPPLVSI